MERGDIFTDLPNAGQEEKFDDLLRLPGARIERIVSGGQASPPGFYYDQDWDEWVLILAGGATVRLLDPEEEAVLRPGSWLFIPRRRRHRVERTEHQTLWLAVHCGEPPGDRR